MDASAAEAPTNEEYLACQLSSWYPDFSCSFPDRRKGITLKSRILQVPSSFRPYLVEDGVRLPPNTKPSSCLSAKPMRQLGDSDSDDSWSDDSSEEEGQPPLSHDLSKLTEEIRSAIKELGGSVIPKLNWSSPKDATWINEGTLQCSTAADVYLLLKSSDFVSSDLELLDYLNNDNNNKRSNVQIILRKWANLHQSHEFRCFVKDRRLVAVSQRHADQHFEHVTKEQDEFLGLLEDFIGENVVEEFSSSPGVMISNFVIDIYVDRQDRAWIVDFNVWGERTDSLLFDWNELRAWPSDKESEIRAVETEKEVRPHPLNNFRAPVDTVHIASITGGNANSFKAFMEHCQTQESESGQG